MTEVMIPKGTLVQRKSRNGFEMVETIADTYVTSTQYLAEPDAAYEYKIGKTKYFVAANKVIRVGDLDPMN